MSFTLLIRLIYPCSLGKMKLSLSKKIQEAQQLFLLLTHLPDYQTNPIMLFTQHLAHAIRAALSSLAGPGKHNIPFNI